MQTDKNKEVLCLIEHTKDGKKIIAVCEELEFDNLANQIDQLEVCNQYRSKYSIERIDLNTLHMKGII